MLLLALWSVAAATGESPVAKVVAVLAELKAKTVADGQGEQKLYDQFACWCEETIKNKKADIASAEKRESDLTDSIRELKGRLGSGKVELARVDQAVKDGAADTAKASTVRGKEAAAYAQRKADLETAIENLDRAIGVLGALESDNLRDRASSAEETKLLTVAAGVRHALGLYSKLKTAKADVSDSVKSFFGNPSAWVQTQSKMDSPHKGTYKTQSDAVLGMIKDMHDSFQRDLEDLITAEKKAIAQFKDLMITKAKDQKMLQASLSKLTSQTASDDAELAADTKERKDTQDQLTEDRAFLDTTETTCKERAAEWSERSRLRTEELTGMQEALTILSEGESQFEAASSAPPNFTVVNGTVVNETSFIQLAQVYDPKRAAAYQELERLQKQGTPRLSALASAALLKQKTSASGHFDEIIARVDRMIASLKREEADDEAHKDWCVAEKTNAESKESALEYDSNDLGAKLGRLLTKKAEIEASIAATQEDKSDLKQALSDALDNRVAEEASSKQGQADDRAAIELLAGAIAALGSFSANHKLALVAGHHSRQDPEPGTWSGSYGGASSGTSGVISLLEKIKEEYKEELKTAKADEKFALDAYWNMRKGTEQQIDTLDEELVTLEEQLAGTLQVIKRTTRVQGDTNTTWAATSDYLVELKPNCDWVDQTYATRKADRDQEVTELKNSILVLSGAELPSLLKTRSTLSKTTMSVAEELRAVNSEPSLVRPTFLSPRRTSP
jgi:chromosome segregation ATPase